MVDSSGKGGDHVVELAGKVMVVGIILLFFVAIFFVCLHLYFRWFYLHRQTPIRRRRRLDFSGGHEDVTVIPSSRIGLEASVLKSIPVVAFDAKEFEDGLECAVCLCEVLEGEKARILPKCRHGFHVECIDMWFHSHATCPLCRNSVSKSRLHDEDEAPNLPANVLFFGPCVDDEDQPSTSATASGGNEMVVIDVNVPPLH
ncbi:RING-H2 finger protein ATL60-like [Salvia hispanica]|uniref:RING-H2 finger protein ATL60-like n=1 Tax=Salvia hispanica TaxID=49212 RepID=UPI00200926B2|nr:RING-H2 finger protein ATL60-like [Salvia hispanica]